MRKGGRRKEGREEKKQYSWLYAIYVWFLQLSGFRFFSTGQNCLRNLLLLSYYWNANPVCVNRLLISHFSAKKKILIWKPKNRKINRVSDPFLHEPMQSRFIITRCHCIYKLQFGKLLYSNCWSFLHLFIYCETFTFIFLIYIPHFKSDYLFIFLTFQADLSDFLVFVKFLHYWLTLMSLNQFLE